MLDSQMAQFDKAMRLRKESTEIFMDYWLHSAIYTSFEFWFVAALFLVPLLVIVIKIDKSQIFFIGFYGFCVHMISFYFSLMGVNGNMELPYSINTIPT